MTDTPTNPRLCRSTRRKPARRLAEEHAGLGDRRHRPGDGDRDRVLGRQRSRNTGGQSLALPAQAVDPEPGAHRRVPRGDSKSRLRS